MFEKYTERARRVLFFARYEASQFGSVNINTDHVLLGLIREGKGLTNRIFAHFHVSPEDLRKEIEGRAVFREKVSTTVEIPFTNETMRVLTYAADEATRLKHDYIGTEHLLLGLLREESSPASTSLIQKGMCLDAVRDRVAELLKQGGMLAPARGAWVAISEESKPCCFCGETFLDASFAVLLQISRVKGEGDSQYLYAHPHCLRNLVRSDVPLITDFGDQ
jgi:ATP-dependent Clp protease ATP-binding subunit ClpC